MKDYIALGNTPSDESCVQVGDDNYDERSRDEAKRYITQLRHIFRREHKREPECLLRIKSASHDFGSYIEVVAEYTVSEDDEPSQSEDDAFWLESNEPSSWDFTI